MSGKDTWGGSNTWIWFVGLAVLLVAFWPLVQHAYSTDHILIPWSVLALLGGVIFEFKRLTPKWSTVFITILCTFLFSLIFLIPGEKTNDLNERIRMWPYWFILIFTLAGTIVHKDKTVARIHEGITLLLSLSVVYWIVDEGLSADDHFHLAALGVAGVFTIYSMLHALLPFTLTRRSRLVLSIWSCITVLFLAVINMFNIHSMGHVEETDSPWMRILILSDHFILGISGVYLMQNFVMLLNFLPGRGDTWKEYRKEVRELKKQHIKRFSAEQLPFSMAIIILVLAIGLFGVNHYYQLVSNTFAIWLVFLTAPHAMELGHQMVHRRS